jgi:hypothetical protein
MTHQLPRPKSSKAVRHLEAIASFKDYEEKKPPSLETPVEAAPTVIPRPGEFLIYTANDRDKKDNQLPVQDLLDSGVLSGACDRLAAIASGSCR